MAVLEDLKQFNKLLLFLLKYGQSDLVKEFNSEIDIPKVIQNQKVKANPQELVHDLQKMGPVFIKLGQIFSTQAQFLPVQYDEALQQLQDDAEPMPYAEVEKVFLNEFKATPLDIFQKFSKAPLSAASLGQVHLAEFRDKKKIAVKVQRLNIQNEILEQLHAIEKIVNFFQNKTEWGNKYNVAEKYHQLKQTLLNELDYLKEANNLKILNKNLDKFEHIVVPLPLDDFTTSRILTMEYVKGEKITDLKPIQKIQIETEELADELFRAFLKQILIDGFFQMDPHPGNVFLTEVDKKPMLALLDMGMVAQVPFQMQGQLIRCLFAMAEGRELDVIKVLLVMGKKLENFDEYFLRTKITDIIGTYKGLNLSQIPVGKIVLAIARTAAEANLWLPIQFSTIGKTLLSIDPVIKALNPNFEPLASLQQNAYELMKERLQKQLSYRFFYNSILESIDFFQQIPGQLTELISHITQGESRIKLQLVESKPIAENFEKIANRITMGILLASLVISAAFLMRIETSFQIFGYPGFAMLLFLIAGSGAFILLISILLNDRKKKNHR